ncbi:exopolysaccharide biosynthesis protein [Pseudomonas sp. GX19020]|uniref:exopolysaccharide biosynthesis protein n=1 Tax=Pseudomonas sp. GX19020 TaxID=2942277 RepID=UPI0020196FA0|nr:exopolysaccharide biosynthesis protein [Pseudomonas sp. GX19020]MCL4067938.1 exopolysaccharide biosynthesis protein [Pseudomonas sp. GX19020]
MDDRKDVLSAVLDQLDEIGATGTVSIGAVAEAIGARSFATLMLIFALIAVSPASIVPGVTTVVALVEFLLVAQMIAGRRHIWLPELLSDREIPGERLRSAVSWLRRPIAVVDQILQPRLSFLTEKPCLYIWLFLILALTLVMPFMELVPGTGTVASGLIALVAAAVLTRDGALLVLAGLCLGALVWMVRLLGEALF